MIRYRILVVVCALLAVVALAACGDEDGNDDTVDASQVEKGIDQSLSTATTEVASVSCPDDVKSETGAKFTCSAKLSGGGSAKVEVTETKAPGRVHLQLQAGDGRTVGHLGRRGARAEPQAARRGVEGATVNCPDPVRVEPGTTVSCPVSGTGGGVGTVSFESASSGSIDQSSVQTRRLEGSSDVGHAAEAGVAGRRVRLQELRAATR